MKKMATRGMKTARMITTTRSGRKRIDEDSANSDNQDEEGESGHDIRALIVNLSL
jgi:hypothetical protein